MSGFAGFGFGPNTYGPIAAPVAPAQPALTPEVSAPRFNLQEIQAGLKIMATNIGNAPAGVQHAYNLAQSAAATYSYQQARSKPPIWQRFFGVTPAAAPDSAQLARLNEQYMTMLQIMETHRIAYAQGRPILPPGSVLPNPQPPTQLPAIFRMPDTRHVVWVPSALAMPSGHAPAASPTAFAGPASAG